MDVKEIRKLLDALASTDVNELTLETGEYKLTVRRGSDGAVYAQHPQTAVQQGPVQQPQPAAPAPSTPEPSAPRSQPSADTSAHLTEVNAPIVGTFYAAPSPDADDYVKVGDRVERGAVLCIIEAMKLMNEIEAETAGVIKEILVRNEEPVEYGQVLFRIDPR
ncbi:MAG: acetyl-CoA carboxylase biotin carboxyl carrier protein [Trueperaceae bacterium]